MKQRNGFTLLELLLAITVLVVILSMVYVAFAAVVNGVENTRERAAEMRVRQFLSYQIARNLTAAYIDPVRAADGLYYLEGLNDEGSDGPKDSLTFYSTATIMGSGAFPGDIKLVTFEIIDEDSEDDFDLDRSEKPDDALPEEDGVIPQRILQVVETPFSSPEIAPEGTYTGLGQNPSLDEADEAGLVESPSWTVPVRSLNIQYFDGEQWVEEWNSYDYQRLPWCVRIAINFPKTDEQLKLDKEAGLDPEEDPDFEMDIPIPAAGIGILSVPSEVPGFDPFNESPEENRGDGQNGEQTGNNNGNNDNDTNNNENQNNDNQNNDDQNTGNTGGNR